MCEIFACCRVTSRLCYSQTWRPFWFIVACVISFGAVYAMTIGGWGLIAPPVDYALAGLLAIRYLDCVDPDSLFSLGNHCGWILLLL